ncbi:MAG: MFS transporter [Rhodospirillales bacterium]
MGERIVRLTGLGAREQAPAWVVSLGHGATHWIAATFYLILPYLTEELGLSYTEAGVLVSTFHVSSFLANFGSGMVVDVLGRRVLVQAVSLVLGAVALMAFGLAGGLAVLMALVAVVGGTNNLWHPAAISFLSGLYPNNRGYVLSIHTLGASLGDSLAPLCVGAMLAVLSWRDTALWGSLPVLVVAVLIVASIARMDKDADGQVSNKITVGEYFSGLRVMFTDRAAMGLCLMAGFRSMTQNGLLMFIPIYLANVLKVGPFMTGVGMFAMQIGGFFAGPIAGAWSDKKGRRPIVLGAATGTTIVVTFLAVAQSEYLFIAGVSALGFVLFAIRPVIHSWMMDLTPPAMHGSATSALFGVQSGLSLIVPVLGGWIADLYGVGAVFYLLAATMLLANVLVAMLPDVEKIGG